MSMQTRAFDAQDALYDALKAATYPGRVTVSLGSPASLEADHIWVSGSIEEWDSVYRVSGLAARDETFNLRAFVWSKRLGRFTDARDRATALGDVVEATILGDHTLTGTVDLAVLSRTSLEDAVDQEARSYVCLLGFTVTCQAYIPDA